MAQSTQAFVGTIKSFNISKGWGHIECEQTHQLYGKDIFLLRSQVNGIVPCKGDSVYFDVNEGAKGQEATNVQIVSTAQLNGEGAYIGTMKSWNPVKGWGHVECETTHAMYGKDIFVLRSAVPGGNLQKGDQISFSVQDGTMGVEVTNVKILPSEASIQGQLVGSQSRGFVGSIKSFDEEKGWGHIDCAATRQLYGKDMFVMRSALNGHTVTPGTQVRFSIVMGAKGAEARDVIVWQPPQGQVIMPPASISPKGSYGKGQPPAAYGGGYQLPQKVMHTPQIPFHTPQMVFHTPQMVMQGMPAGAPNNTLHWGSIKNWNEEKGWGFISCQDTMNIYGKDIFLHKKELSGQQPLAGTPVQFGVEMGPDGRPIASNVSLNGGYQAAGKGGMMNGFARATPY